MDSQHSVRTHGSLSAASGSTLPPPLTDWTLKRQYAMSLPSVYREMPPIPPTPPPRRRDHHNTRSRTAADSIAERIVPPVVNNKKSSDRQFKRMTARRRQAQQPSPELVQYNIKRISAAGDVFVGMFIREMFIFVHLQCP